MTTTKNSVKIRYLEDHGYISLEDWINDDMNLYVGRRGRIWIYEEGTKRIFHYTQSKWHNPYKDGNVLPLFLKHILNSNLVDQLWELKGLNLVVFV